MAHILGLRIKNFRNLKDVSLGQLAAPKNSKKISPLTPLTVLIGKNGTGKSALLDVFGFLADCLKIGVEDACDKRGGYDRIVSKGQRDSIQFEIYYKENINSHPMTYELAIALDSEKRPYTAEEILSQEKGNEKQDIFLELKNGKGRAWSAEAEKRGKEETKGLFKFISERIKNNTQLADKTIADIPPDNLMKWIEEFLLPIGNKTKTIDLADKSALGLAVWGEFKENPRIVAFREFIEGWYLAYFAPDAARSLPFAKPQTRLSKHGDNLANVALFMEQNHPEKFKAVLDTIAKKIPGLDKIDPQISPDGRLLLRFNDKSFKDPFYAQQISDGTLKLFAYLLMLAIPNPPSFICIEEPENGLYHKLLGNLVSEFRNHAKKEKGGSQIFLTTHQPYLLDVLSPEEVWILKRQSNGFSTIERASDNARVRSLIETGDTLGELWSSDYLD